MGWIDGCEQYTVHTLFGLTRLFFHVRCSSCNSLTKVSPSPLSSSSLDSSKPTPRQYRDMPVQPLGNVQATYDRFLQSCVDSFGRKGQRCVTNERERIAMSLRQPQSMTNYSHVGFKKIRAPPEVFKLIKKFWDENKERHAPEQWGTGNTYSE